MKKDKTKEVQHKKPVEFRGKLYKSINKVADEVGIPSYTINHRLRKGMSLEEAVGAGLRKREITYNGITYDSLKELGKSVGIGANVLSNRILNGMTVEEAVTTPVKKRVRSKNK